MPLPFCDKDPVLPNNKYVALNILRSFKKRLLHDSTFSRYYVEFMQGLLNKGHAEKVPDSELTFDGHAWYIPIMACTILRSLTKSDVC